MSARTLPEGYGIRGARPEEIPAVTAFAESVFRISREYFLARYRHYPGALAEHSRLVVRGKEYVAHQRLYRHDLGFAGSSVRAWAVGDVCTSEGQRRMGLGFALLEDCIRYVRAQGAALCLIRAGLHDFYCQAGWEIMPLPSCWVNIQAFPLESLSDGGYLTRTFEPERDLWAVAEVHRRFNVGRSLVRQRDGYFWAKMPLWCPWQQGLGFQVAEHAGLPVAYGRIWDASLGELCYLPGHEQGAAALLTSFLRLARARQDSAVRLTLPADHALWPALAGLPGVESQPSRSTLLRLVSLRALFEQTLDGLSARLRASSHELAASLTVRCQGEEVTLVPRSGCLSLSGTRASRVAELTQRQLLHLGAGLAQPRELLAGQVGEDMLADLSALFPPGNPIYWNADSV